jgi:hypothetical protein
MSSRTPAPPHLICPGVGDLLFDLEAVHIEDAYRATLFQCFSARLYQTIAQDAQRRGMKTLRVGGTSWFEPEINF